MLIDHLINRVLEGTSPERVLEGYFILNALKARAASLGGTYLGLKAPTIDKGKRKDQKAHTFRFSTEDAVTKFEDAVYGLGYETNLEPLTVLVYAD